MSANESFSNASGGFVDDMNFTGDDFFGASGQGGGGGGMSASQSQPYIINVSNKAKATPADVANFAVLGSYEFSGNAGFSSGSLVIDEVTISSGVSGITYQEMLQQFANNPFSVGLTYLQSSDPDQVLETLAVNTRDANGNEAQKTLVPIVDPYQQQNNIIAMKVPYRVDGFTKIRISRVIANKALKIYFYPSENINLSRGLAERPVSERYASPGIIRGIKG